MGVKFETNVVIGKTLTIDELFDMDYKAVFIGSGAGLPNFMGLHGEALNGVYSANDRRSMEELPARREEVEHAMEEGVEFMLLNNPVEILGYNNPDDKLDPRKTTSDYIILTYEFVMFLNYGISTHKYIHSSSLGFNNIRNVNSINNINFTVTL